MAFTSYSLTLSIVFLVLCTVFLRGGAHAKRTASPSVSPSASPSVVPNIDPCAEIPNSFQGFQSVCGNTLTSWAKVQERFPMLMIELGVLNGTLTTLNMPGPDGIISTQYVLVSLLALSYCKNSGAFHHTATVYVPGLSQPIVVESLFIPLDTQGEQATFCEVRKGDTGTYGYPLRRLSVANGKDFHAQIGRDLSGNLVDGVFNFYPNQDSIIAFSISNKSGQTRPDSFTFCNYTRISSAYDLTN